MFQRRHSYDWWNEEENSGKEPSYKYDADKDEWTENFHASLGKYSTPLGTNVWLTWTYLVVMLYKLFSVIVVLFFCIKKWTKFGENDVTIGNCRMLM